MEKNNPEFPRVGQEGHAETAPIIGEIGAKQVPTIEMPPMDANDLPEVPVVDPAATIKANLNLEVTSGPQLPDAHTLIDGTSALQQAYEGAGTTNAQAAHEAVIKFAQLKEMESQLG